MPLFFTRLRNAEFYSRDDGVEHVTAESALAVAVQSAMRMAADEIGGGCRSAAVEITVERDDGTRLLNSVVAISVSPLMSGELTDTDSETSIGSEA